jgi:hypothetical protein
MDYLEKIHSLKDVFLRDDICFINELFELRSSLPYVLVKDRPFDLQWDFVSKSKSKYSFSLNCDASSEIEGLETLGDFLVYNANFDLNAKGGNHFELTNKFEQYDVFSTVISIILNELTFIDRCAKSIIDEDMLENTSYVVSFAGEVESSKKKNCSVKNLYGVCKKTSVKPL